MIGKIGPFAKRSFTSVFWHQLAEGNMMNSPARHTSASSLNEPMITATCVGCKVATFARRFRETRACCCESTMPTADCVVFDRSGGMYSADVL